MRHRGGRKVPARGGALVVSNHQSFLDPVLVGIGCPRVLNIMARETLFRVPLLGRLIRLTCAFPVDRAGGKAGIEIAIALLKAGEAVLVFPEGTRARDGRFAGLKPGFTLLARRARVPVVPVWVEGSFRAWPADRKLPLPKPIRVIFGDAIAAEDVTSMKGAQLAAEVERRLRELGEEAGNTQARAVDTSPPPATGNRSPG